ncbi:efflux RND transporter periplasmic adaptor subunit [Candidatus Chlorohelix sp.]|uniref:efflux RND transporter periplasmic adaptor subunit n=1 Tax=Candidatus Chlorohelix sp. TaxID=3139201 RepID=UPI00307129EA
MRRYLIPVLVIAVLLSLLGVVVYFTVAQPKGASTTIYTVRSGTITATVRATGRVESSRSQQLSFRSLEVIRKIYVKPGDTVPVGTLLAELDTTNLERNLARAEGERDIARFNLSAAQERASNTPTLTPAPTPEPQSYSGGYAAARQVELTELQVATARQALEAARLYAPFDGTVLMVNAQEGESLSGALIQFSDLNALQIRADIDELDVPNAEIGQPVVINLDAFSGKAFDGKVSSIASLSTQRQGSSSYSSIISFNQKPDIKIRIGMAATVTITSLSKNDVLLVPLRGLESIGLRKYVNLIKPDGSIEKTPVEIGITSGTETEIVRGISAGDKISIIR